MKASQSTAPPNKHMQCAGTHKVLGRGRSDLVLTGRRTSADVGRSSTLVRVTMNLKSAAFTTIALVCSAPISFAENAAPPTMSASDLSTFVSTQRYRIYTDYCSAKVPELKSEFDRLLESLVDRNQEISRRLLASGPFDGLMGKVVPAEVVEAFRDTLHDTQHNFERRDASDICPKTLQSLKEVNDRTLTSNLSDILTAVQKMLWNLENGSARTLNN
ncbi:MAG: hypothetical protein IPH71_09000 [Proteobacteria bacterium]|nr:hypothetical protein [Pseudomonadota bacterium]